MSGDHRTPGAPLVTKELGYLRSRKAPDENGRVFDRCHDAEFKLLTDFCNTVCDAKDARSAVLWSKKPLCLSCANAVNQLHDRFPCLHLEVKIGESDRTGLIELSLYAPHVPSIGLISLFLGSGLWLTLFGFRRRRMSTIGEVPLWVV
eukprot:gnl/TRDRNA2_/TRDRNA2_168870_c1_seq1.p1 gnl/TRDRNA2_/TRDRNA2_168870_c1~~gnl/TRDRNA2_/TRDRNA2_168870_c1_seq1.p1  ORF type:complete len:162 (-),score=19.72 gnl/TRDRNA2_/TRDRNA2_168870_c1_seq1:62-505(-)